MAIIRKNTAALWLAANPTLRAGEQGLERDTKKSKVGDGVTSWKELPYQFDRAVADSRYAPIEGSSAYATLESLASKLDASQKGMALGVASLDSGSKILEANIPTRLSVSDLSTTYAPLQVAPVAGHAGLFDSRLSVYNLKPTQLRATRAALGKARAGTGFATLGFIGDSTVGGQGGVPGTSDWPTFVGDMLANDGFPKAGPGWIAATNGVTDARVVKGAGWTTGISGSSQLSSNATTSNPITFTLPACTSYTLYYLGAGGTDVTIATDGAGEAVTPPSGNVVATFTKTGLTNTTHTVSFVRGSVSAFVVGVKPITNATSGVRIINGGLAGKKMADVVASSSNTMVTPIITNTFDADCVFLMTEVNDAGALTPVATYKASAQTGISYYAAAGADVVLVTAAFSGFGGGAAALAPYNNALYELADENNLPLIDLQHRWGSYTDLNADGLASDVSHPSVIGYADIARAVIVGLAL
jgi:lysophospholipase L1-like esterase